jgi:hypothetical protein
MTYQELFKLFIENKKPEHVTFEVHECGSVRIWAEEHIAEELDSLLTLEKYLHSLSKTS